MRFKDRKSRGKNRSESQKKLTVRYFTLSISSLEIKQLNVRSRSINILDAANQLFLVMFPLVTITISFRSNVLITAERGLFSLKLFLANFLLIPRYVCKLHSIMLEAQQVRQQLNY